MPFDYEQALKDGVPEEEVAKYLASTRNFDLQKHINAGFSNREIINHLAPQKSAETKPAAPPVAPIAPITPTEEKPAGPPSLNEPLFKETFKPPPPPVTAGPKDIESILAEAKRQEATAPPGMAAPKVPEKKVQPLPSAAEIAPETPPPKITPERKEVTPPFAARHPYLAAIPPTIWETAKEAVPFGKYAGEEGRAELKGDFFPPGTTTDPEKLKEIEKELVTGKKKISPYESLAKETMSAAELAAFPTAARVAGAIGEEILPAALTRFLKTPIGPWLRSLTNKERGLVTQSLEDMISKGYSEGDVLRRWNNSSWREEALRRRNKGEEYPPFAGAGEPEPSRITPPGVAPEGPEPLGSTIPGGTLAPSPAAGVIEAERVGPPGIETEAPEPVGTTMPAQSTMPTEAPRPIPPMGVGPGASPEPKPVEAPAAPIPPMMGMGQEMPVAPPEARMAPEVPKLEEPAISPPTEPQIEPQRVQSPEGGLPIATTEVKTPDITQVREMPIGTSVMVNGKEGKINEANPDGTISVGFADGTMADVRPEEITPIEPIVGTEKTNLEVLREKAKDLNTYDEFRQWFVLEGKNLFQRADTRISNLARELQTNEATKARSPVGIFNEHLKKSTEFSNLKELYQDVKVKKEETLPLEPLTGPEVSKEAQPVSGEELKPAIVDKGEVIPGEIGGTHSDVIEAQGLKPDEPNRGFVTPEGKLLNRKEAAKWVEKNQPEVYAKWREIVGPDATELFSEHYREAAGIEPPDLQSSATEAIPPTAQHLEEMPEEYPNIDKVAVRDDTTGEVFTDSVHGEIIQREGLDPDKVTPGFTTKQGEFVEQYPEGRRPLEEFEAKPPGMEDIFKKIKAIYATVGGKNPTTQAYELGKTLTGDQLKEVWKWYEDQPKGALLVKAHPEMSAQEITDQGHTQQMAREVVAGALGEDQVETAFSRAEIEKKLSEVVPETLANPPEPSTPAGEAGAVSVEAPAKGVTPSDLHTQVNATQYEKRGPVTAYIVDGEYIRKNIDEEFSNFAQHFDKKFVPENEVWLDKENVPNEYPYTLDNALTQRRLMSEGMSYDEALKKGDAVEKRERVRANPPKKSDEKLSPQLVEDAKKELLGTIGKDKIPVWLVAGDMLREVDPDFVEGGNDGAYKWMPKKTIIIDDDVSPEERPFIIAHELYERDKMLTGLSYNKAHPLASQIEHEYREDPTKFEASKKFAAVKLEPAPAEGQVGNWEKGESRPFAFDPNSTENQGRFRLLPTENIKKDSYFYRKSRTPGVSYIVGKDKTTGDEITQAIRFDKSVMPEEKAAKWWEENKGRFPFAGIPREATPAPGGITEPPISDFGETKGFTVSPTELPYGLARDAHAWNSMVPEERGKQAQQDYASSVQSVYDSLKKYAKTENQTAVLDEEMMRFKAGYLSRYKDILHSKSRTASAMVTGPSGFNTRRNQKALDAEMNKTKEMEQWKDRAINSIKGKLKDAEIEEAGGAVAYTEKELKEARTRQELMKTTNAIMRKKDLTDEQKIHQINEKTGLSKTVAKELLNPDFANRKGFADFELTNNLAKIKRLEEKVASLGKKETAEGKETQFKGGVIAENTELDRLQILFDTKPTQEMINKLKSRGFHWSPSNKAWQRQLTDSARLATKEILGIGKESKSKSETEGKRVSPALVAVPFALPFLMGSEEKKKKVYPWRPETPSYLPPGMAR